MVGIEAVVSDHKVSSVGRGEEEEGEGELEGLVLNDIA